MKRFQIGKATGKVGTAFVAGVVFKAGSIFREVPQDTDIGIDGYIEFVENELPEGILVGVQIKAGASYLVRRRGIEVFQVVVSRADLEYWKAQPIPVALIACDPDTGLSGWIDLTDYIRRNPEALEKKYTTLTVEAKSQQFSAATFRNEFKSTFKQYKLEADLFDSAELMASPIAEQQFRGFFALLRCNRSRFSTLTCLLLLKNLFSDNNGLRASVTDALSRYLLHPEISYCPPSDVTEYVESAIRRFGRHEVLELLRTALLDEENLMQRGSLGQCAGVIIAAIPNHEQHLSEIAMDDKNAYEVRLSAMVLASEFSMYHVMKQVAANVDQFDWGGLQEPAQWLTEEWLPIELEEHQLWEIIEESGYDADRLADVLRESSVYFVIDREATVVEISMQTSNPIVRFEATRCLDRADRWRHGADRPVRKML